MLFDTYDPFLGAINPENQRAYQKGLEEGIKWLDEALKQATKQLYRDTKRNLVDQMSRTTTTNNHECNCEFCCYK